MLTREDNGKHLACRAQNPVIKGSKLESKIGMGFKLFILPTPLFR